MPHPKLSDLESLIIDVPDFPIKDVTFKDISPLLSEAFHPTIDALSHLLDNDQWAQIEIIAGIDARGFVFAAALADRHQKGLVMVRKDGKLPPPVHQCDYALEYGTGTLEMKPGNGRVLIVDDVLATGGTLQAAQKLCVQAGYNPVGLMTLINLAFLNDFDAEKSQLKALFRYD